MAQQAAVSDLVGSQAALGVVRADAGLGGTRLLREIEAALSPGRSLYLCPAGAEPLGSLRNAFARSIATMGPAPQGALGPVLAAGLDELLAGEGVEMSLGAELVAQWVALTGPLSVGAVLIDDAQEVDDPSLDVVVKAAELKSHRTRLVVRLDEESELPFPFEPLPVGLEIKLGPLSPSAAEELAASLLPGQLGPAAAARWARRGRYAPLGIVEAVGWGATAGEVGSDEETASPRDSDAEPFLLLQPKEWIQRRLFFVPEPVKKFLQAVAVLGMDAEAARVRELLTALSLEAPAEAASELEQMDWLRVSGEICSFTSRTHREGVLDDIDAGERRRWHEVASVVVERLGGALAYAEAARHAALCGNNPRAVELALSAAKASRARGLDEASEALLAFVAGNPEGFSALPAPTTVFRLESWIEALRASGEHEGAAARLQAIALLAKGETAGALQALRQGMAVSEHAPSAVRSREALAYGIGLAVAGRRKEALDAALEALAHARRGNEARGQEACARFLARLSRAAGHPTAADVWEKIAGEKTR